MELGEINAFLAKLDGIVYFKKDELEDERLVLFAHGIDSESNEDAECTIAFDLVSAVHLPTKMLPPCQITVASADVVEHMIGAAYRFGDCHLYQIEDAVKSVWYVYAGPLTATLP